jgi:hypothetical protein
VITGGKDTCDFLRSKTAEREYVVMKPLTIERFIQPHQFNFIRSQLKHLLNTVYFAGDFRVYAATKQSVSAKVLGLFPSLTDEQEALFEPITAIRGRSELEEIMTSLADYVIPFGQVTANELKKLFPKVKKLTLPDLDQVDWDRTTYLGWRDVATESIHVVYPLDGRLTGTHCRYVLGPANRSCVCSICGDSWKGSEVGLVVAVTKSSQYKSVGMHMCLNSEVCNQRITQIDPLESLIRRWQAK